MNRIEEGKELSLDFLKLQTLAEKKQKVLPVVIQEIKTGRVLMVGYINRTAFKKSLTEKRVVLWSTSRNELWIKGATSGNFLKLEKVKVNCEQNSLLFLVTPQGNGICHTKCDEKNHRTTCFYREIDSDLSLIFDKN